MWLKYLITLIPVIQTVRSMSQSFVNSSSSVRPTFVVNFDISSVICQTSADRDDLKIFPISILCDGKKDCFENPAMDDETFPYCSQKCVNKCSPHGTCLMDGGRSLCYCNDGFSGKKCDVSDVNECSKKPCHWLARCTNTFGSYYCTCLPGFEGDGHNCTDIDECSDPTIARRCPENAKCCNIPGSYFCNCTEGFAPKGSPLTACVDIDECAEGLAHCEDNTTCVNTIGSYQCVSKKCHAGFQEINEECIDIDECKQHIAVCDPRAECINTNGSYECTCSSGFTGNGKICTPLADCSLQPSICHKHAFCVVDLKMCLCQSGFIGDGINCYDMNECSTEPPVCKVNEKCSNLEGSFLCCPAEQNLEECKKAKGLTCNFPCGNNAECRRGNCVCKDGFAGDPNVGCVDRNECALNATICPADHWCVNLDGSYMCCSNEAPLTMCRGLLVGIAPEINEIHPNVSTVNINISAITPTSTQHPLLNLTSHFSTTSATLISTANISTTLGSIHVTAATLTNATNFSPLHVSNPSTSTAASISAHPGAISSTATHSKISATLTTVFYSNTTLSTPIKEISIVSSTHSTSSPVSNLSSLPTSNQSSVHTSSISPTTIVTQLPIVGFTVHKNATIIHCSEDRLQFCRTRNMSCSVINGESRCVGCAEGFVENEHGICTEGFYAKLVRCDIATDCDHNAKCIDINPTGHLCVCKVGFIGDGKRCDDADECYTPNVCSPNAHCINNVGSYNCVCNEGFVGNGDLCTERHIAGHGIGCSTNSSICHEFATCAKDACQCKSGYTGDGVSCTKIIANVTVSINDCAINSTLCDPNAECVERHCQCRLGYLGDGILCRPDPDDCHLNLTLCGSEARCVARRCRCLEGKLCKFANCETNPDVCHVDAFCIDKLCKCNNGFEGNGTFCKPSAILQLTPRPNVTDKQSTISSSIKTGSSALVTTESFVDGCDIEPSVCHRNAKCIHNQCMCDEGYVGNGRRCIPDPNDCLAYPSICHQNATCVTKMKCQCKPMFTGDGTTSCEPIKKEENCALTPNLCHEHASCISFKCQCNKGYKGDGKICSINTSDCSAVPSICHDKATCTPTGCVCNNGYIGDGRFCSANVDDCTYGGAVCDLHARCVDSRCKCNVGYTGSGIVCTRLDDVIHMSQNCRFNSSICDSLADCIDGKCVCKPGYSGTGLLCKKDLDDCYVNPSLCDPNAFCLQKQCHCNANYVGNGTVCIEVGKASNTSSSSSSSTSTAAQSSTSTKASSTAEQRSTTTKDYRGIAQLSTTLQLTTTSQDYLSSVLSSTSRTSQIQASTPNASGLPSENLKCSLSAANRCHKNAECYREDSKEECRCHAGFSGDGKDCEDINECSLRLVHCFKTATCVNTMGSFMCLCPPNQKGDGIHSCSDITKDEEAIDVECERDGLTLLMNNRQNFNGKIFVKNQSQNPRCSKNYTSDDGPSYKFTAPFAYCDVRMEPHNTFSTVVVVQKHPLFVTDGDEAYNLRCTYPAGEVMLMSHFNVSMLSTVDTLSRNGPMPQCSLSVLSALGNESIAEAIVGQQLQLRLVVEPQATYGIVAKNCVAVNMENGETYKLTDSEGCAIDASIFPEWSQFNKSQLYANFLTFKWPDTAQIRFQCDCSPCFDQCEPIKCKKSDKLGWGKKKRETDDSTLHLTASASPQVFSNVLQVRDSDKVLADDNDDTSTEFQTESDSEFVYSTDSEDLCVNSGIFAAALGLAASFAAVITVAGICGWQQRESEKLEHETISVGYENRSFDKSAASSRKQNRPHNAHKRSSNNDHWSSTTTLK